MQNDSLFQSPHPNLDLSRGALTTLTNIAIKPGGSNYINLKGIQTELKTSIDPGTATKIGFVLEKNENNTEYTKVYYDYAIQSFVVDRTKASLNANTPRDIQTEPFALPAGKPIDWQLYIDGSVIEVFINNKWAFATRIYPTSTFSNIIDVFCEGGNASAATFQAWSRGDLSAIVVPPLPVNKTLKVWPMPANDKCYIQLPGNTGGKVTLTLYDANGKKIKQSEQRISASTQFITYELTNTANLKVPSGIYFCNISINGNENYKIKLDVAR
jgi:beta-fructofuranosidase